MPTAGEVFERGIGAVGVGAFGQPIREAAQRPQTRAARLDGEWTLPDRSATAFPIGSLLHADGPALYHREVEIAEQGGRPTCSCR